MKIQDLLNQSKPCWKYAAMDWDETWWLYREKPYVEGNMLTWTHECEFDLYEYFAKDVGNVFDIEPFDGDWKDSLICREERGL